MIRGAICGDVIGSRWEGAAAQDPGFELLGTGCCATDDSVLTAAVAEALLDGTPVAAALRRWGNRHADAGYGALFSGWLTSVSDRPYGSFGNGAPMRCSPCALLATGIRHAEALAVAQAAATHNHPDALRATAAAAGAMARGARRADLPSLMERYGIAVPELAALRASSIFDVTATGTVGAAAACVAAAESVEAAIRLAVSLGGDTDTTACVGGALAEAVFGCDIALWRRVGPHVPNDIAQIAERAVAAGERTQTAPWGRRLLDRLVVAPRLIRSARDALDA